MSVKVMLASGSREVMGRLATVVTEVADLSLAGRASTSNAVPSLLRRTDVDVLVVDEGLRPMVALDLVRDVVSRFPYVAVVVASQGEDLSALRSAVDAGARGLVSPQMSFEEIAARLRVASTWSASVRALVAAERENRTDVQTGSLVAVTGAKGGVGVTTVATRLALDAAHAGRSVCLVDLDLQAGDVGVVLDIDHHRDVTDLVGVDDDSGVALQDSLYTHRSGLRVLLAPRDGERGEDVDREVARQVLSRLRSRFDVVVVDAGSQLTEAGAVALSMAEHAVVVTTPDVVALRAARRACLLWARLEVRGERDCEVLLNRVSKGSEVQPATARRITGLPQLRATLPAAFRRLEEAVNTTTPPRLEDRPLRDAYARLAQELSIAAPGAAPPVGADDEDEAWRAAGEDEAVAGGVVAGDAVDGAVPVTAVAGEASHAPGRRGKSPKPGRRGGRAKAGAEAGSAARRRLVGSRGSLAVETAALAPIALAVVLLLMQVALTGYTYVLVGEAANRASRALAVGEDAAGAREAALAVLPGGWQAQDVAVEVPGGADAEVTVSLPVPLLASSVPFPWTARATSAWGEEGR